MIFSSFDFNRRIDPIFREPFQAERFQGVHQTFLKALPFLMIHREPQSFIAPAFLASHSLELVQNISNLFNREKSWDELQPKMQRTALIAARLALSIWFPFPYLIVMNTWELATRINQLSSLSDGEKRSACVQVVSQLFYLVSLCSESEVWSYCMNLICLRTGEDSYDNWEKEILKKEEAYLCGNGLIDLFTSLSLLFKIHEEGYCNKALPSLALCVGHLIQSFLKGTSALSFLSTIPWTIPGGIHVLYNAIKLDFRNQLNNLLLFGETRVIPLLFSAAALSQFFSFDFHTKEGVKGPVVCLDDVTGCEKAKETLRQVIHRIQHPEEYASFGSPPPPIKGILFYGPPGTGKTMLAKALAGELGNGLFLERAGSSFVDTYVGTGAASMRALFERAEKLSQEHPDQCVVLFIDEINAILARRRGETTGGEREYEGTTESFLTCVEHLPPNVIVVGATNIPPRQLDPAAVRSGRFDEYVEFSLPTPEERGAFFARTLKNLPLEDPFDQEQLRSSTEDFSFADLKNVVDRVKRKAGSKGLAHLTHALFTEAITEIGARVVR